MNKISEICIANIVSWIVSQAVYHNTNRIVTKYIVTPLHQKAFPPDLISCRFLGPIIFRSASLVPLNCPNLTIIGSDNGLSPGRRQAIIWTNVGILLIKPLRTNFSEILIEIIIFSVKKMHLKMSSGNWRPFGLDLNELSNPERYG